MKKSVMILTLMALSSICFCGLRKGQSEENCNALRLSNIEALSKPVPVIDCSADGSGCKLATRYCFKNPQRQNTL